MTIDDFITRTSGKPIRKDSWDSGVYIVPRSKISSRAFTAEIYGSKYKKDGSKFTLRFTEFDLSGSRSLWSFVQQQTQSPMDEFIDKYRGVRLKRAGWKKNYVIPIGKTSDTEFHGHMYEITTNKLIKTAKFDLAAKTTHDIWTEIGVKYKESSAPQGEPHKCHCDLREMMAVGCKCGGI